MKKNWPAPGPRGARPALATVLTLAAMAAQPAAAQLWTAAQPTAQGVMLALDRADNTYVVGSGASTGLLSKYGPNGALLWQMPLSDLLGRLVPSSVTVDAAGNAVVTAGYVDAAGRPNGLYVVRYGPGGQRLTQDMITGLPAYALRAGTDALGDVYVLGGAVLANASGNSTADIVTFKLAANGLRQWVNSYGFDATSGDFPASLAVTPDGRLLVGGQSGGQMLLLAYDSAGALLLGKRVAGSAGPADVVVDATGAVWVVGGSDAGGAGRGFLVIKHDAQLNELWRQVYPARGEARRAAVDSAGNLLVTGAVDTNTGLAQVILYDWLTLKIDPQGNLLWQRSHGQPTSSNDVPMAIAVGTDDSVVITGEGRTPATATPASARSTATVRYLADGTVAWTHDTASSAPGVGVSIGSTGDAFVLGQAPQTVYRHAKSLAPTPTALRLASSRIVGGNTTTATVQVSGTGGSTVALSSSHPAVAGLPSSVVIPAGATIATVRITTYRVKVDTTVTLRAQAGGVGVSAPLVVLKRR